MIEISISQDIVIHLGFIFLILLTYRFAYNSKIKYLKLAYTLSGLLIFFYNLYLQDTIFAGNTGINVLGVDFINYGLWLLSFYLVLKGVANLWK